MNSFKIKQLRRVIESISKAANLTDIKKESLLAEYTDYKNYEEAIKELIYEVHKRFYNKNVEVYNYSLDMINNISSSYFKSKEDMIMYAENRKKIVKKDR